MNDEFNVFWFYFIFPLFLSSITIPLTLLEGSSEEHQLNIYVPTPYLKLHLTYL
jgi:hypothetical protein